MPIKQRGPRSFLASFSFAGQRYNKSFKTKKEAQDWEQETIKRLEKGEKIGEKTVKPMTLLELANLVNELNWRHNRDARNSYQRALLVCAGLGENTLATQITQLMIDKWIVGLISKGNSNATINRKIASLSAMLRYAYDINMIERMPKIKYRKESKGRVRYYSEQEEKAILEYFSNDPIMQAFYILSVDTGFRCGEILKMEWENWDKKAARLDIEGNITKNGEMRSVPLTKRSQAALQSQFKNGSSRPVPYSYSQIRSRWDKMKEELGYGKDKNFVRHTMRHTFCSRLAQAGADIRVIQEMAGHKTLSMTQRYSHLCPQQHKSAIALLERDS